MNNTAAAWRPDSLDAFIGQTQLIKQLRTEIAASRKMQRAVRPMLLCGPQGLGKSSLARIISLERSGMEPIVLLGKGLTHEKLTYTLLDIRSDGYGRHGHPENRSVMSWPTLILEEAESLDRGLMELMHPVLEPGADGRRIFQARNNAGQVALRWCCEHTQIWLTNYEGSIVAASPATVSRFPIRWTFQFYSEAEMAEVVSRHAQAKDIRIDDDAVIMLAARSNGMPRMAIHLLGRAMDYAMVNDNGRITKGTLEGMFEVLEIDGNGLDRPMRDYLQVLASTPKGRMSVQALSSILGLDPGTLAYSVEPVLMKRQLIFRSSSGREITPAGRALLGGNNAAHTDPFWSNMIS